MWQYPLITLLTDFGGADGYVGTIEGVIACINPQIRPIHLSHDIPAQNLTAASFCLANCYDYFPQDTVHLAIVDPGVGSRRRAIAVKIDRGYFVVPDNGLLTGVLGRSPALKAVELTNSKYWRTTKPSLTFHARDIFAPVAAHLVSGVEIEALGRSIDPDSLHKLASSEIEITATGIKGSIQYIDRFGNLMTNIPVTAISNKSWSIRLPDLLIPQAVTYSSVDRGLPLALISSGGWLEIGINCGNASEILRLTWGDEIEVVWDCFG
jgi:S-adenosyl-L-methionine hydrolase (adenosine-forming)